MGSLTNALEKEVLDHILKVGSYSPPAANVYIALFIGDPTDTGAGGTEVSAGAYGRKIITFGAASARQIVQSTGITFSTATGDWGIVTHYGIMSAIAGGTMLAYGAFSSSKNIVTGNTPTISAGDVIISINSGGMSTGYANKVLDWLFRQQALVQPTNIYVGLFDAAINDSDTAGDIDVNELVMTGYNRTIHNSWNAATGDSPGLSDNNGTIDFGQLTGTGETIESVALLDVASGAGNILFYDNTVSQPVASGDTVKFLSGAYNCTMD